MIEMANLEQMKSDLGLVGDLWPLLDDLLTTWTPGGGAQVHRRPPGPREPVRLDVLDLIDGRVPLRNLLADEFQANPTRQVRLLLASWLIWAQDQVEATILPDSLDPLAVPALTVLLRDNLDAVAVAADAEHLAWLAADIHAIAVKMAELCGETALRPTVCPTCKQDKLLASGRRLVCLNPECDFDRVAPEFVPAAALADRLHVPRATVRTWIARGQLTPPPGRRGEYSLADAKRLHTAKARRRGPAGRDGRQP